MIADLASQASVRALATTETVSYAGVSVGALHGLVLTWLVGRYQNAGY